MQRHRPRPTGSIHMLRKLGVADCWRPLVSPGVPVGLDGWIDPLSIACAAVSCAASCCQKIVASIMTGFILEIEG